MFWKKNNESDYWYPIYNHVPKILIRKKNNGKTEIR